MNTSHVLIINKCCFSVNCMEVELLWRRHTAPSVALRGGLRLLRLAEFVRYNRAAIGGPSKRLPMNSLDQAASAECKTQKLSSWCIRIR